MSLIAMAVYSTETNKKDECLAKTLKSLDSTVDFGKHRLMLSVNGATEVTKRIIHNNRDIISKVFWNDENLGTAEAINLCWKMRKEGEHCVKMDDDVVIHQEGWLDLMEESIRRDNNIGIIGLKRKDCWEKTTNPNPDYKSELIQLPQVPGERWLVVEKAKHIIGTCQAYNSELLDKMGYLFQYGQYGYDDVLASWRSSLLGFKNVFLFQIEIDHIDEGNTSYQGWKERKSGEQTQNVINLVNEYIAGTKSTYYNPFIEK